MDSSFLSESDRLALARDPFSKYAKCWKEAPAIRICFVVFPRESLRDMSLGYVKQMSKMSST